MKKQTKTKGAARDASGKFVKKEVEPRAGFDAFRNMAARMGAGTPSLAEATEYVMERWTNDYFLMLTLFRNHWIARRIVEGPAADMTKAWPRLNCKLTPEEISKFDRAVNRTQTPARIRQTIKWARLFGGAGALMVIDGHEGKLDEPLDVDDVMPGQYKGLIVFDRWSGITPGLEVCTDPARPLDYGLPEFYDVRGAGSDGDNGSDTGGTVAVRVHCSRVLRFTGPDVPSPEFEATNRWGLSVLEPVYDEIRNFDNSKMSIGNLLFRANILAQVNPELANLQSGAAGGGAALAQYQQRMQFQNELLSNQSMMLLGKDGRLESHQYTFGGISDVLHTFLVLVAGAAKQSVTKLFGRVAAGLGETGESEQQQDADNIAQMQQEELKPQLEKLYPVICMSEFGEVPDDLDMIFPSTRSLSDKEKADLVKSATEAIMAPYTAGVRGYGSKTILKELRNMADTTGFFSNITDEMIDAAPDDDAVPGEGEGPDLPEIEKPDETNGD